MYQSVKGKACMMKWIVRSACVAALCLSFISAGMGADTFCYTSEDGRAYIKATGTGYYRLRGSSGDSQQKLMARRAAVVDSYRRLLRNYGRYCRKTDVPNRYERVSGYVSGVEVRETRYYSNGKVEVDTVLPLDASGEVSVDSLVVCRVVPASKVISKQEYEDMFGN